ncbi:MAG TPA: diacylglycerol kinase family protein [Victivallales bacterium]|nr:diacylglycerol kinase family protein [Victivallales bacterium]
MMPDLKGHKVFCFLNPLSCEGYSLKKWPVIEGIFKELSIRHELISCKGDLKTEVERVLREIKPDDPVTFAGLGGDGTHCAIINAMLKFKDSNPSRKLPFYSIIPFGTGNNIAKSFRLSRGDSFFCSELRRSIAGTVYGAEFKVDVGRVNGIYFLDAFTVGIDAHILTGRNRDRSLLARIPVLNSIFRGYPLYVFNTIKSFRICKPLECKVELGGNIFYEGGLFNAIANNTRIYAGEFDPTDNAIANDGLLDLALHSGRKDYIWSYLLSYRRIPRRIRRILMKWMGEKLNSKFSSAKISFQKKIPAQIDGEEIEASDNYIVEVFPQAISLKIPVEPA